jgi:para-aminobenzoate synthetase component II
MPRARQRGRRGRGRYGAQVTMGPTGPRRILVIDNYDSFVYNLVQYLAQLGAQTDVRRNDEITVEDAWMYDGVLLSPGPGIPEEAGICVDLVRASDGRVPIFGVCLGLQAIGVAYGGTVGRAPELLHGKTSQVFHSGGGVLHGLPSPFTATRYHSLAIDPDSVPAELEVTGYAESGVIMAVRHRDFAVEGVQFHPESVLTEHGHRILANWLVACGDLGAVERSSGLGPLIQR